MKSLSLTLALLVAIGRAAGAFAADLPPPPPGAGAPGTTTNAAAPRIKFDDYAYDFGKVTAGQLVEHDFIVSNAGDATLIISDVRGTCSCTTAGVWTKEIEPGKTGVVPIKIDSTHLRDTIHKMAIVTSNDKAQPTVTLQLKGTVWQPIEVHPLIAYLHVVPGVSNPPAVVRISNKTGKPLTLSPPESANKVFTSELKTIEAGNEFELLISAVPPVPAGNTTGTFTIKTSSPDMPTLTVTALALAPQPAIVVTPPKIILAASSQTRTAAHNVLIRSTIADPLALTNAAINAKGVDLQVKELQAGRQYNIVLTFPPGFQAPPEAALELSVTSNYPQFPVIKVPITQLPSASGLNAKQN